MKIGSDDESKRKMNKGDAKNAAQCCNGFFSTG
jgi:hypothetical protein